MGAPTIVKKNSSASLARINRGIISGPVLCASAALLVAMAFCADRAVAEDEPRVNLLVLDPPQTTPRRPMPEDRFAFRGEHAGVIYAPRSGYVSERFCSHYHRGGEGGYGRYSGYPSAYQSEYRADRRQEQIGLGASYEIVRPSKPAVAKPAQGRYELQPQEEVISGEFVEIYHPAVYRIDEDGKEQLAEEEELTRVPKVRIVLRPVWVEGAADESGGAPAGAGSAATHSALPAH